MDPKSPLSLQYLRTIVEDKPSRMEENIIGREKHEEMVRKEPIRG